MKTKKLVFKTDYCLMHVKSIAECSKRPSLSYNLSLRSLFCLFLSGCLRQVLLYMKVRIGAHIAPKAPNVPVCNKEQ